MGKASDIQIGGNHYKGFVIEPFEFFIRNKLPFHKADIVKRILRYDRPTGKGLQDLEKIKHVIDLIIQYENWRPVTLEYPTAEELCKEREQNERSIL